MRKTIFFYFLLLIIGGCSGNGEKNAITTITENVVPKEYMSSYLKEYKFVKLETIPESLIGGMIGKIRKFKNKIFISSDYKRISVFDNDGKFLYKINKVGAGPQEYVMLCDFDVYDNKIFILDIKKILIFNDKGDFLNKIDIDFMASNIKILSNNKFAIVASGSENVLYIINNKGNIINSGMKNKQSTRLARNIPFINLNNDIFVQSGYSNDVVLYNQRENRFKYQKLLSNQNVVNTETEEEYVKQSGFKYIEDHPNTNIIDGLSSCNTHILFGLGNTKGFVAYIMKQNNFKIEYTITKDCFNDITFTDSFFFDMCSQAFSEDCFITFIYPSRLIEGLHKNEKFSNSDHYKWLKEKFGTYNNDDNPILIELKFK